MPPLSNICHELNSKFPKLPNAVEVSLRYRMALVGTSNTLFNFSLIRRWNFHITDHVIPFPLIVKARYTGNSSAATAKERYIYLVFPCWTMCYPLFQKLPIITDPKETGSKSVFWYYILIMCLLAAVAKNELFETAHFWQSHTAWYNSWTNVHIDILIILTNPYWCPVKLVFSLNWTKSNRSWHVCSGRLSIF